MKKILIITFVLFSSFVQAQEIQAKLSVVAGRVSTQVDKKIFQTLQTSLTNFVNNRKWTNDVFQAQERIKCNFLINIDQDLGNNVFKGSLTIQAARPVYGSTYESPIINFLDNDFTFRYVEFQAIEFNENRVQGNDALAANIPAILAYYIDLIIGLDYDSFSPRGGDVFFQRAQNIVNSAPESHEISGWKAFDGTRNRFRLIENLTDNRYALFHDAIYSYYRNGFDQLAEKEDKGRLGILNALTALTNMNKDNPNTMFMQVFFQGKSNELIKVFTNADADTKTRARDMLTRLDITNASAYRDMK